jgi:hypothetical protein
MRSAPPLLACVLLLAACGASDEPRAAATATATVTVTASPAVDPAADERLAEQATLVLSDLPADWTEEGRNTGDDDSACEGFKFAQSDQTAQGSAPRFRGGPATHVLNRVYLFPDEPKAAQVKDAMGDTSTTARCFGESLAQALADEEGIDVGKVKAEQLNLRMDLGDDAAAASRVTIGLESKPVSSQMVVDLVAIRVGRGMSLLAFVQGVDPFDERVQRQVLEAAAGKLADAMSQE